MEDASNCYDGQYAAQPKKSARFISVVTRQKLLNLC
jgi:hypothetical protein